MAAGRAPARTLQTRNGRWWTCATADPFPTCAGASDPIYQANPCRRWGEDPACLRAIRPYDRRALGLLVASAIPRWKWIQRRWDEGIRDPSEILGIAECPVSPLPNFRLCCSLRENSRSLHSASHPLSGMRSSGRDDNPS